MVDCVNINYNSNYPPNPIPSYGLPSSLHASFPVDSIFIATAVSVLAQSFKPMTVLFTQL